MKTDFRQHFELDHGSEAINGISFVDCLTTLLVLRVYTSGGRKIDELKGFGRKRL
jgi:hypothetical protein